MTTKEELISQFSVNAPGISGNIFGLPFTPETSEIILLPVPWDVTVTYGEGTALAPRSILEASVQLDHANRDVKDAWKLGVTMLPVSDELYRESLSLRAIVKPYIQSPEATDQESGKLVPSKVNEASENLNIYVKNTALSFLNSGKLVGLIGGDHSTPIGLMRALGEKHDRFGILQVDAHADLRKAYQGFTHSHGSVMFNALKLPGVSRLVQIGVRDFCDEETDVVNRSMGRVKTFFDADMKSTRLQGKTWASICDEIIRELPPLVYISFDIDGLDPKLCPHTGTPVPGGFEFDEIVFLFHQLVKSGKKIIGFDLCEVGPSEWDANVGARILNQLCTWTGVSQGKLALSSR